jgi:N-dimethylarginine dimethylaminohydrolase
MNKMILEDQAAYSGGSFNHREDKKHGFFGCNSEYATLRKVVLGLPTEEDIEIANECPEGFQLLGQVNYLDIREELDRYTYLLNDLGVSVVWASYDSPLKSLPNFIFTRDLFAMSEQGPIIGRPATLIRAEEEFHLASFLALQGIPIWRWITKGIFEGSDFLWATPNIRLVGTGCRTSLEEYHSITTSEQSIFSVKMNPKGNQHLLGALNIIDKDLACIRPNKFYPEVLSDLRSFLELHGYKFIEFEENEEIRYKQAMNLAVIAPKVVVMPDDCPETRKTLERNGVEVYITDIQTIRMMAGGLACLTGPLQRDVIMPNGSSYHIKY